MKIAAKDCMRAEWLVTFGGGDVTPAEWAIPAGMWFNLERSRRVSDDGTLLEWLDLRLLNDGSKLTAATHRHPERQEYREITLRKVDRAILRAKPVSIEPQNDDGGEQHG